MLWSFGRFEFRYKQSVTTSDNFLGISGKDPSSTCCDHLVVTVQLPHCKAAAGEQQAAQLSCSTAGCSLTWIPSQQPLQMLTKVVQVDTGAHCSPLTRAISLHNLWLHAQLVSVCMHSTSLVGLTWLPAVCLIVCCLYRITTVLYCLLHDAQICSWTPHQHGYT